jgi:hypothetical protein
VETAPATKAAPLITVPETAVTAQGGRRIVWVFRDDRVERRAVNVSRTSGGEAVLASGLTSGEKIVINPPATLTDGAAVREAKP